MHISTIYKLTVMAILVFALSGCTRKNCADTVVTTKIYTPIRMATKDYWASIKSTAPKEIGRPGKIYTKDQYIYVNEPYAGIHIIDNSNPASPKPVAFLNVMGTQDMAIKGNILYTDSYGDLNVFDITDPRKISFVKRLPGIINLPVDANGMRLGWYTDPDSIAVGYTLRDTTYVCDCTFDKRDGIMFESDMLTAAYNNQSPGTGKGGSMARFTIAKDYLYTVNYSELRAFDLSNAASPAFKNTQTIGRDIETIFPYGEYLFIGSRNAMFIYDLTNPAAPGKRSEVTHFRACDPVVVEGSKAFVTVRSGSFCAGNINQLQVFDISNVDNPVKINTVEMKNPFGLGVDHGKLFICEGSYGLRFMDAADVHNIITTKFLEGLDTYDVIPYENQHRLLVSARDGIYQYDYTAMNNPKLLSKIAAKAR
ncbi:LVIVD repeat-containing protein [Chitinophaga sp. 22321]|uniref:LVIVD repeat-containing protein n=1 Tax=Chitinophaga hostae TaxID=2831022 RepID=A0ABS5J1A4_9BACT|nr:hypothetical protein [Chitinophaga hostae]MBS0028352.1 hypothetical protein [Chitinophaga hostae]